MNRPTSAFPHRLDPHADRLRLFYLTVGLAALANGVWMLASLRS